MGKRIEYQPGEKRGRLTYVSEAEPYIYPHGRISYRMAHLRCDCGSEVTVKTSNWRTGVTVSCGCARIIKIKPNEKHGRLTFIEDAEPYVSPNGGHGCRMARLRCDCGNEVAVKTSDWRSGVTRSCGCLQREIAVAQATTHGQSGTKLFSAWQAMTARASENYQQKTGKYVGVTRDERWSTFEGFLANQPAGRPFEPGLVLARTGDVGPYSPENTRWATKSENAREAAEVRRARRSAA